MDRAKYSQGNDFKLDEDYRTLAGHDADQEKVRAPLANDLSS